MTTTIVMMMIPINFKIKSKDSFGEIQEENVTGKKTILDEKICYEYGSQMGFCKITLSVKEIKMERDGEAKINFVFNKEGNGEFRYETPHFEKNFQIKKGKFKATSKKLDFSYEIYEENFQVNSIKIEIEEK
ncbi:MAG: DUF1934 family protein [Fusobacteriaceae bacterium]